VTSFTNFNMVTFVLNMIRWMRLTNRGFPALVKRNLLLQANLSVVL